MVLLGEVEPEDIRRYNSVLLGLCSELSPIDVVIQGLSCYYLKEDLRANALAISSTGLDTWRYLVTSRLRESGLLKYEPYGFSPHMTMSYGSSFEGIRPLWERSIWPSWKCSKMWFMWGSGIKLPFTVTGDCREKYPY
jgi:2'-5' RNA ligase